MGEKIDPTWLAWSYREPPSADDTRAGIRRLSGHYGELVDYPLKARAAEREGQGFVILGDAEPLCRWPFFAEDESLAVGYAYVPSGFGAVTGIEEPSEVAALALARALLADPRGGRDLAPPVAMSALDKRSGELVVLNDWLGAGRCLEVSFENGRVLWTNRPAAPFLFSGEGVRADVDSWRVLAGSGWFMGRGTPFEGVRRVAAGSVIRAAGGAARKEKLGVLPELVRSTEPFEHLRDRAAEATLAQVRLADALWEGRTTIELSGGRDSRVIAAAAIAAGSDARVVTSDRTIGEADVARELISRASGNLEHRVRKSSDSQAELDRPLMERALNVHLLHDGLRHAQKVRGNQDLPRQRPASATLSGHGGEIAHGFYYGSRLDLAKLAIGGRNALLKRASKPFPNVEGLARAESHEAAKEEIERELSEGEAAGLSGAELLEWCYLTDRFPNRSGLASHAERLSVFAMPSFIAASFAMKPAERTEARLHTELIARFVPEWAEAPFFKPETKAGAATRRRRLWESPEDAKAVEALLESDGAWTEMYVPERMRSAWDELKTGAGNKKWEAAYEGAVYREAFEQYLTRINALARV